MTQDQEPEIPNPNGPSAAGDALKAAMTVSEERAAAMCALDIPAVAVLARMMRLGWGMYYQAQAELRVQLTLAGWDEERVSRAVTALSRAEQLAVRTDGPPTLAELDDTLNTFGRGLVAALREVADANSETAEDA